MFSALKKFTNRNETSPPSVPGPPGGVKSMATKLQRKYARGCDYNLKIVIRGDRNTGKSCLLARLQGKPFEEQYIPTEEIKAADINWSYKNTEDIVKVDVWDVVDVAKKRKKLEGLKMTEGVENEEPSLDAEFIDVYKGTHGAILIFDITKPWTFDYVKKECEKVPPHIPILILANFADVGHHRQVTKLQVAGFVENLVREGPDSAEVRWAESSLRNGFGLKFLHNFFNIPFLTLQRQSLIQQLEVNQRDIEATSQELDLYMDSNDADYEMFSENLTKKRRQTAEQAAPPPTASIVAGQPSNVVNPSKTSHNVANSNLSFSNRQSTQPDPGKVPTASVTHHSPSPSSGLSPIVNGSSISSRPHSKENSPSGKKTIKAKVDVDNFVPDSGDFDTFLDEEISQPKTSNHVLSNHAADSSDEENGGNPMVAKFQDEVEDEDYENNTITALTADIQVDSSSDEEQDIPKIEVEKLHQLPPASDYETCIREERCDESVLDGQDNLNYFLSDKQCDKTTESYHSAYESF